MTKPITYADAGVDIDKANDLINTIKKLVKQTPRSGVMGEIGGFGGLYSLNTDNIRQPVLVSSTDGVGTKLKIAVMMDKHDTIGIDLVAMSINDIAVQGARPLFFLDYLSVGRLIPDQATAIIQGVVNGCKLANCALIGGETAEMPGLYNPGEYDLAGFAVGIVDNDKIIDGSEIHTGQKLIGIASSGLHSNGFSLIRKICFDVMKLKIHDHVPDLGRSIGEELLEPTRIYSESIRKLKRDWKIYGLAHITGGGLTENIARILPRACKALIYKNSWEIPPIFSYIKDAGRVSDQEMMRTFNNGIGLAMIVSDENAQETLERLKGLNEKSCVIGEIMERESENDPQVQWK